MPSRDIHSRDGGKKVRDLLTSFISTILIGGRSDRYIYLISPWISDFILFDNEFGQYRELFKNQSVYGENPHILFSQTLTELSFYTPIRIVTWPGERSDAFADKLKYANNIEIKIERVQRDHQKGLLAENFYFEGSMNFTYSGIYLNSEKVICSSKYYPDGHKKILEAFLEFERIWNNVNEIIG
ncbi:hypothetical protein K8I28_05620 [bacterium]|nr:hypothetical protein [bacterium]